MGIIVNKEHEENDILSKKITQDLSKNIEPELKDDEFEENEVTKNSEKTKNFAWVWFVLIFLAIISLIAIAII